MIFSLAGILPAAIVSAAFLVPLVYLVYLYDVNLWEDESGRAIEAPVDPATVEFDALSQL